MSDSFRVAWFVATLVAVFTVAYWLGQALGPFDEPAPAHERPIEHRSAEVHP